MIVADTHVLLWQLNGDPAMGRRTRRRLEAALASDTLCVSTVSFWEIAILVQRGRLGLTTSVERFRWRVLEMGIRELPVSGDVALQAAALSALLVDPADCFIGATAIAQGATVATADARLLSARGIPTVDAKR